MQLIIAILMIAAPAIFLIYWGRSGYDWGTMEEERKGQKDENEKI
ncbi:hypothetical protein [Halobacillus litoralis]|nr:hypothetical protein [Halobacillus litoralis]